MSVLLQGVLSGILNRSPGGLVGGLQGTIKEPITQPLAVLYPSLTETKASLAPLAPSSYPA